MANVFSEEINAHKSIYSKSGLMRRLNVKYSMPERGVNSETGVLVIVPGYGGNIDSNVYRHIREDFPDLYNCIVIQCAYFGSEYMQVVSEEIINRVKDEVMESNSQLQCVVPMHETEDNMNDMGIMQAIDVITATLHVLFNLQEDINTNKIIIFGTSHGAYIAHLANILCPGLYKYLLDISGYIKPFYIDKPRLYRQGIVSEEDTKFCYFVFDYLIHREPNLRFKENLYDLKYLYGMVDNKCRILCYQGIEDWMVDYEEKQQFMESISYSSFTLVTKEDIDGAVFKNPNHGLGLDYILFLKIVLEDLNKSNIDRSNVIELDDVNIDNQIYISYGNMYPSVDLENT